MIPEEAASVNRQFDSLHVAPCGPERAGEMQRLTRAAFAPYRHLDPPSGAVSESATHVVDDLMEGGGAVAERDGRAVGCLRWNMASNGDLHVRRVAVEPELQRQGIGGALMGWAEEEARRRGCRCLSVGVRVGLPGNLDYFRQLGYVVTGEHRHEGYDRTTWLSMRKTLR